MVNYTLVPIVPTRFQFGLQSFDLLVRILHFYFDVNNVVPLSSPISTSNEEKTYSKLEGQKWNTKNGDVARVVFPVCSTWKMTEVPDRSRNRSV